MSQRRRYRRRKASDEEEEESDCKSEDGKDGEKDDVK